MKYLITGRVNRDDPVVGLTSAMQGLIPLEEVWANDRETALERLQALRAGTHYRDLRLWWETPQNPDVISAPWSVEQVDAINAYQRRGAFHELTCGHDHVGDRTLFATRNGLVCPHCAYTQAWVPNVVITTGGET